MANLLTLTNRQIWQMVLLIFVVYWPLRLYVTVNHINIILLQHLWLGWILEMLVTLLFFRAWLVLTDWSQLTVSGFYTKYWLNKARTPVLLMILGFGVLLAVLFNAGICGLWHNIIKLKAEDLIQLDKPPIHPDAGQTSRQRKFENGLTILALLSASSLSANFKRKKLRLFLQEATEQLQHNAEQSELMILKNHIDSQLVFKNLKLLTSLIRDNPRQAVGFITHLSRSYRYIAYQARRETVTLREELAFLQAYTRLIDMHLGETFHVTTGSIPTETEQYRIIPLSLQILIDNALRHNKRSNEVPLLVTIEVEQEYLVISNLIWSLLQTTPSTGPNLQVLTRAYQLLTNRPLLIENRASIFVVKIPLLN